MGMTTQRRQTAAMMMMMMVVMMMTAQWWPPQPGKTGESLTWDFSPISSGSRVLIDSINGRGG